MRTPNEQLDGHDADLSAADNLIESLRQQLETERMRNVACDVVAMADTPTSAEEARKMLPDYRSAALESVIRRVDECISLRQQLAAALAAIKVKDEAFKEISGDCGTSIAILNRAWSVCKKALAIQPDDSALKAWLGEPVRYIYKHNSAFGDGVFWSHRLNHNGQDAIEAMPLYSPKGMK